jgi:hypothetical protein
MRAWISVACAGIGLAACGRGVGPPSAPPAAGAGGFELTPSEVAAGVAAADIVAAGYPPLDPRRYGASAADGAPNGDRAALQRAVDVAAVAGGAVVLPRGTWNGCVTITAPGVSLVGEGSTATVLKAADCDAITLDFVTPFGNTVIRDLYIEGQRAAARTAIKVPGTQDARDELYGLTVERVLVRHFNVGFASRTLRNFAILNSWFQQVDRALELVGKNLVGRIENSTFVFGGGAGGEGPRVGITVGAHDYPRGGVVPSEGVQIVNNQVYGFDTGIVLDFATVVNVLANDFQATVVGVEFSTVQQKLNINDNTFNIVGERAKHAIFGRGLASAIDTKVSIERNGILGSFTSDATGIQINEPDNTYQYYVDILGNFIDGMTSYDIVYYNPGPSTIARNYAKSRDVDKCIKIGARQAGEIRVYDNDCFRDVEFVVDDVRAGHLRVSDNVVSGSRGATR